MPILHPSVGSPTTASGGEANPAWDIYITNMAGSHIEHLTLAEVDDFTATLNAPDEATFHFPKNAYTPTQIPVLGTGTSAAREVQIFRNGDLLFWGPVIGIDSSGKDGAITAHCAGTDWYLNRRFVDGVIQNHLSRPDFEVGLTGWTTTSFTGGLTATDDNTTSQTGGRSAKLVNTAPGGDDFLEQVISMTGTGVGTLVTLSGWFFIESITAPAYKTRGLYVSGIKSGAFQTDNYYVLDTATPQGKWVKAFTTVWIPPNETWDLHVRLYAPQGTIWWDDIKLVKMDSLFGGDHTGTTLIPIDISVIIQRLIAHMQSTTAGKSDLNIGVDAPTVGVKLLKVYQYVDHIQFDQALREFLERDDGTDYHVRITPTTRTFTTHVGKRGVDNSGSTTLAFLAGDTDFSNCADYHFVEDGSACITRATIIGEDNGPAREQGETADATHIGGTILQDVRQAPQDTEIGSLLPLANETIKRYSRTPQTIELDVLLGSDDTLMAACIEGNLVHVSITDGYANVNDTYRIMKRQLKSVKNILTVTVTIDTLS